MRRLSEEVLERLAKSNRERVPGRTGSAKKGRTNGCWAGQSGGRAGKRLGCGLRAGAGQPAGAAGPLRGAGRVGRAKKKSRARGPARVDQVGISDCSVLAPTGHRGQTSQTGAEEQHGGGLGDGGIITHRKPTISSVSGRFSQTLQMSSQLPPS